MSFELRPVREVEHIDAATFRKEHLLPQQPLVVRGYAKRWKAYERWTPEYFKQTCGETLVSVYDSSKADPTKPNNAPLMRMPFSEYLDIICSGPSELRIFYFNIFEHAPHLMGDFSVPDLMPGFLKKYPAMFFGGGGAQVFLHYDIDLPHLFTTQFHGRKRVVLFSPEWSDRLYRLPYSCYSIEDYKVNAPNYEQFPALRGVQGYECHLEHGDMLYMPIGWWHYMDYLEGGYAITQRAWDASWVKRAKSFYNVAVMRNIDSMMKTRFKQKWYGYKERKAMERAEQALALRQPA